MNRLVRRAEQPIAYLLTVGTYGTRLHGGDRDTVDRTQNVYGEPFIVQDAARRRWERDTMRDAPVMLTRLQSEFLEAELPAIAQRGGWTAHAGAVAKDHVHVVLSCEAEPGAARRLLKRWMSETMSGRFGKPAIRWWAEGGSVRWIWKPEELDDAINYVVRQRTTGLPP